MNSDLIAYVESMHAALVRDYAIAHDKLSLLDSVDSAEQASLIQHIDSVSRNMANRRLDVMTFVASALAHSGRGDPPTIENRYTLPRIARVA